MVTAPVTKEAVSMEWIYLILAGLLEMGWAIGLKYTEGFSRPWPSIWTIVAMIASFYFLSQALKTLPVGTGYAVWTGIGTVGTALLGMVIWGESVAPLRLLSLTLIVLGMIGLKLSA
jgi:quaternary ammonium compound-resistance protein SugE